MKKKQTNYRFSFGPWNIHEGADPFGPRVRDSLTFAEKLKFFRPLGYEGVQFSRRRRRSQHERPYGRGHSKERKGSQARVGRRRAGRGVRCAPLCGKTPVTIDGGYTSERPCLPCVRDSAQPLYGRYRQGVGAPISSCSGWPAKAPTCGNPRTASAPLTRLWRRSTGCLRTIPRLRSRSKRSRTSPWTTPIFPRRATRFSLGLLCSDPSRVGGEHREARTRFWPGSIPPTKWVSPWLTRSFSPCISTTRTD